MHWISGTLGVHGDNLNCLDISLKFESADPIWNLPITIFRASQSLEFPFLFMAKDH